MPRQRPLPPLVHKLSTREVDPDEYRKAMTRLADKLDRDPIWRKPQTPARGQAQTK